MVWDISAHVTFMFSFQTQSQLFFALFFLVSSLSPPSVSFSERSSLCGSDRLRVGQIGFKASRFRGCAATQTRATVQNAMCLAPKSNPTSPPPTSTPSPPSQAPLFLFVSPFHVQPSPCAPAFRTPALGLPWQPGVCVSTTQPVLCK